MRYTYYYIPTDEGTSFNLSLVSMKSLQLNIQYRFLIFGGREGREGGEIGEKWKEGRKWKKRREGGREEGDHSCHNTLQYWNRAEPARG